MKTARTQLKQTLEHPSIPHELITDLVIYDNRWLTVTLHDTEEHRVYETLLQSLFDKKEDQAVYKSWSHHGELLASIDLGPVTVVSVKPRCSDGTPLEFTVALQRTREE